MIQNDGDGYQTVVCDECGDDMGDSFKRADFAEMIAQARRDGWSVTQPSGIWRHLCPECANDEQHERRMRLFDR